MTLISVVTSLTWLRRFGLSATSASAGWAPPNKRLEAGGARRLWNESFFSAPQQRSADTSPRADELRIRSGRGTPHSLRKVRPCLVYVG